jgi:uncharacterized FAD-dependent dehydrogenase
MTNNVFDVGIIGLGVGGVFCAHKLATQHKRMKVLGIDLGRPPMKRRRQIDGWLGCLPSSDGKLYLNDIVRVSDLVGARKSKASFQYVKKVLSQVGNFAVTQDRVPSVSVEKKFEKLGYQITLNDYIQIYPKDVHLLSKYIAETIEENERVTFKFDQEVKQIFKQKNYFLIKTEEEEFQCKKVVVAVGRSGWRWARDIFANFGIIDNNDVARYGVRIELNSNLMKEFNKSNCSLTKGQDLELGPLSWHGTVIPEDHLDMAISAFRANEARWKSDKVSFNLIGNRPFPGKGFEQTDRIGKLTFVITNDRIIKERVAHILTGKAKISILPDYLWLRETLIELSSAIPELLTKAYYHAPTIIPLAPKINIGDNLETEVDGMFVIGESAGIPGILGAACTGSIVADTIRK